ncbi:flagellin [Kiloniella spongiae]|uniref:Flagellin n=1 Tax=Kiloniella spongiae TaxID=1489064 RepID=A0A0H2MD63_9PROT|nr:flagellin [Kiloniella spongiae]KLN60323.1 flagellin [Kiloniella spongiae]
MPVVGTNTAANSAIRFLNNNSMAASTSVAKLASGSRIVRASDDAAGLAISTKLTGDVTALKQAATNASQAASILQVADGGLARVSDVLQRMKALASQSLSGSVTDTERAYINAEFLALDAEILGIETTTTFNGDALIDGTFNENFFVGLGAAGVVNNIAADLSTVDVAAVGGSVSSAALAGTAFTNVTARINTIATGRATVGALISRFETRGQQVATSIENIEAANSKLKDVDLAAEQSKLVTANVLTQAAVSALSQANQIPQSLLRVLQ